MREAKAVYLIGEVNYLEHGGMIVFEDGRADVIDPGEDAEEAGKIIIHQIELDRVDNPDDEWYGGKLRTVARTVDVPLRELVAGLKSENLEDRAESYYDLVRYFGPEEFDQYPITLSPEKAEKRYADVDEQLREALRNPRDVEDDEDDVDDDEDEDEDQEDDPDYGDRDYDDRDDYADPGGRSALRAAGPGNPRDQPCPTCGWPDRLTRRDVELGYQCDRCGDAIEQGREINYYEDEEPEEDEEAEPNQPSQAGMGSGPFAQDLLSLLDIGDRQVRIRKGGHDTVFLNFINLPHGVGGAGGGAEAENNRMMFVVSGFGHESETAPPPTGKVKVELSVSALPRSYNLRAKTGTPSAIARYLADHLNRIAREVPPHFTHTAINPSGARRAR